MDTLINLILAAALQFTGAQVAQQAQEFNHQERASTIEISCENQAIFTLNNKQICKENNTQ